MKKVVLATVSLALVVGVFGILFLLRGQQPTSAANLGNFSAGNIMSDFVMSNKNSMSETDIANFIRSKITCNHPYDSTIKYYESLGYSYHIKDNKVVCIADEYEWFGNKTAANILYRAGQDYNINPQVLLVLLQKEQSLLSDSWPNFNKQYASATGFGCPDTAACDSSYSGFEKQVRSAAALYHEVLSGGWTNYPVGWNYVQYNPDKACGGKNIYIENRATSALYRFTPYQPNDYALAGGSNAAYPNCGAFGNRNFYSYFTDWFGNTQYTVPASDTHLPDGNYSFISALSNKKSLDGNGPDGAVHIWDSYSIDAQKFYLARTSDGFYTIRNLANGKYLDVTGGGTGSGTKVQVYASNNSCAQKWAVRTNGDKYELLSACSGLALDIANGSTSNGARAQIYPRNSTNAQKWTIQRLDNAELANGLYTVTSALSSGMAVDANGPSSNVHLWDKLDIVAQKFQLSRTIDGFYTIKNIGSGKVLDVANASTTNGANVQVYASNNSCAQKWAVAKNGNQYEFLSACSGKAMDISSGSTVNGANIQIWERNGTNAQKWLLDATSAPTIVNGNYVIVSKMSGRALDVAGGGKSDGTNVQTWVRNGTPAQTFAVAKGNDNYYSIRNIGANKLVDVSGAGTSNGTNIQIWGGNNSCAQKWKIEFITDTYYIVTSACSGKAMDMGGNNRDGANVHLWERNDDNANQLWQFVKL